MSKHPDQLTHTLREWSRRQTSREQIDELAQRILAQSDFGLAPVPVPANESHDRRPLWALAAAAVVGLALGSWMVVRWQAAHELSPQQVAQPPVPADKTVLFSALEELFGEQLAWVAETDHEVRIGLTPAELARQHQPTVLIRLDLVAQAGDSSHADPVWSVDVAAAQGELVLAHVTQGTIAIWTCPLPDGKLAVEARLDLNNTVPLTTQVMAVHEPGSSQQLQSLRHDGIEYRLLQTVTMLQDSHET